MEITEALAGSVVVGPNPPNPRLCRQKKSRILLPLPMAEANWGIPKKTAVLVASLLEEFKTSYKGQMI